MTSRARLLATVLLLAPVAFACGKKEEQPPVTTRPASPTPGVAATEAPVVASSPAATTTTPPQPAGTAAPAVSATARPPATAAPKAPVTTQATLPQAPPPPPAATTSAPPPTTQAEKPAATQPAAPARPAAQRPKGKITLPAKLGTVTFDHENHAGKRGIACTTCHHPSRPQKPLASENQACRDCHTMPAAPPMKTSRQAAFHDPKGATGTCIDCHKQKGGLAPVKCLQCHKKK
jgi:outer membrane biosynthesis protein TonB